ncbi:MAG TPA: ergothioneine biosynthesis protein EgtB, partial [Acidimicrobiales bacterium]|nr:ergothioneine biosynthesis protein EgtB [Acidimicrobiales bacterium]
MVQLTAATDRLALLDLYTRTRALTEALAEPLSPEDQTAQSMPDVSPTKWHRAHTSWFFETFVLGPHARSYRVYDPHYAYLFNSYYETVGRFFPRSHRGVLTRPGAAEVGRYRTYVDEAMSEFTGSDVDEAVAQIIELGCHHEAQHQELILMDIKHVLAQNPLRPAYRRAAQGDTESGPSGVTWITHEGGVAEVGHTGTGFAFDNESPRHHVYLEPFQLAAAPVTNGEWLGFMDDGGYSRADLWLSDGWATVRDQGWSSPLYWDRVGSTWEQFTLGGMKPVRAEDPVCHISYYEADAFARWGGARLPTEEEWEVVAAGNGPEGSHFLDLDRLHP